MKLDELMRGDWVYLCGTSCRVKDIVDDGVINYEKDVTPIPLTPEIFKKNGFTYYDIGHNVSGWSIMDNDHLYSDIPFTLTDNDFNTEPGEYKWGPVEDDREESFVREMGRIHYVHELQQLFKICKIDKEIIL